MLKDLNCLCEITINNTLISYYVKGYIIFFNLIYIHSYIYLWDGKNAYRKILSVF